MDTEILRALKESISLFERRAKGEWVSIANPLCVACGATIYCANCRKCPVYEKTGQLGCEGTPFHDWFKVRSKENAQKELAFLKSLLPEENYKDPGNIQTLW